MTSKSHKAALTSSIKPFAVLFFLAFTNGAKKDIDVKKSFVYGPAFDTDIVLPVRYFYIQLVDKRGKK